jgi:hypothetical protein
MRNGILWAAAMVPFFVVSAASATVIYDNTGSGLTDSSLRAALDTGMLLDDATAATGVIPGGAPYQINQVNIGYYNQIDAPETFDILVQFYDNVNYNAASGQPVATTPIGSLFRIPGVTVTAYDGGDDTTGEGETGLISLTGTLPITTTGSFGIEYEFVTPGGNLGVADKDINVLPLVMLGSPALGSSNLGYAYDYGGTGSLVGDAVTGDVFTTFQDPTTMDYVHGNFYLAVGASAVPEPASLSLVAGSLMLLSRRRARTRGSAAR